MTRKYSLLIECDSGGYSADVPELPSIVVTVGSIEELTARAKGTIRVYWEACAAMSVQRRRFRKLRSSCRLSGERSKRKRRRGRVGASFCLRKSMLSGESRDGRHRDGRLHRDGPRTGDTARHHR